MRSNANFFQDWFRNGISVPSNIGHAFTLRWNSRQWQEFTVLPQRGLDEAANEEFRSSLKSATEIWFCGRRQWMSIPAEQPLPSTVEDAAKMYVSIKTGELADLKAFSQ